MATIGRRLGFGKSGRMKNDKLTGHCWRRARNRRFASCQGIS